MDNTDKNNVEPYNGKANVVDPNWGRNNVPIENLNISVDLYVMPRNRSFINVVEGDTDLIKIATANNGNAPFFHGSDVNTDGKFSFTTQFTEVGSDNLKGEELLGITSIDIEFNSALMPLVSMRLSDIRGIMHQNGNDSPFNGFFNMPYPIFKLVVKGYYGQPVEYLLHMTKYNSLLSSNVGNFDIKCEFIGHNFAYLSDMLLGYLKAIPYTTEGKKLVAKKKAEDPSFVTFDELYEYAKSLNQSILKIKEEDTDVKTMVLGYKTLTKLEKLRDDLVGMVKSIDSDNFKNMEITSDYVFMKPATIKTNYLKEKLNEIRESLVTIKDSEVLDIDINIFKISDSNFIKGVKQSEFVDEDRVPYDYYSGSNPFMSDLKTFKKIANAFSTIGTLNYEINLFHYKPMLVELNNQINDFNKLLEKTKNNVTDLFFAKIDELTIIDADGVERKFKFNIQNYTKVLCDHVDILMESIRTVSSNAELDDTRKLIIDKSSIVDIMPEDMVDNIYAFPDYRKKVDGVFQDAWIGDDYSDLSEVIFIKELYAGLVTSKQKEDNYQSYLENFSSQWYGVNPFDSIIYMGLKSPWDTVRNSDYNDGEILKLLVNRAMLFLGYSNRNLTDEEITLMAKLEANNLFHTIDNQIVRDVIATKNSSNGRFTLENIRKQIISNYISVNEVSEENKPLDLIKSDSGQYRYIGKYLHANAEPGDTMVEYFIPLIPDKNYTDLGVPFIQEEEVTDNKTKYFFGNQTGNEKSYLERKFDRGAAYIDFLSPGEYEVSYGKDNTYSKRPLSETKVNKSKIFSEGELSNSESFKNVLFNGKWNVNEFMYYDSSNHGKDVKFFNYFYENQSDHKNYMFKGGDSLTYIIGEGLESESLEHIDFGGPNQEVLEGFMDARSYSLFGSDLYYQQDNDYAKALLFLHTLPFKGLGSDDITDNTIFNDKIINLFNQKASFIEVPFTWILFIGGILYRHSNEDFIKFKDGDYCYLPWDDDKYKFFPQTYHYLKTDTYHDGPHNYEGGDNGEYRKIDKVLVNLPDSVKNKFIKEFTDWVDNGEYRLLAEKLEVFNWDYDILRDYYIANARVTSNSDTSQDDLINELSETVLNQDVKGSYEIIEVSKPKQERHTVITPNESNQLQARNDYINHFTKDQHGSPFNFRLKLKDDSPAVKAVLKLMRTRRIIVNSTWRIWSEPNRLVSVADTTFEKYISIFFNEFERVNKIQNESSDNTFGMTNSSDIYLTIYRNIKSIKDKWISSDTGESNQPFKKLIDTFKFIDRGYNDIGTKFNLNPLNISSLLTSKYNDSLYSHISKLLSRNNFDFIPMPNYVDMKYENLEKLFQTYSYNEVNPSSRPSFICMYIGERSNALDSNRHIPNDSFNFNVDNGNEIPADFKEVPAFVVRYGDENQSIFKELTLDQSEYSETNESLAVTDSIANSYNNIGNVGQNLFNVYVNRAYNCKVVMMGNAMIQPFMYFQLHNVPMFRGAYIIVKVEHSITPNTMTTTITGNRVKRHKTKFLDKTTIFNNLIGNFNEINVVGADIADIKNIKDYTSYSSSDNSELATKLLDQYYDPNNEKGEMVTPNFKWVEFKSGIEPGGVEEEMPIDVKSSIKVLASNLEVIKAYFNNAEIVINSGYRRKSYNDYLRLVKYKDKPKKRPKKNSRHILGEAADIVVKQNGVELSPATVKEGIETLIKEGKILQGGVGLYDSFVHYDIRGKHARWVV
jgi:hypothetical protein